jgi:sterol desaturase/sphingolipid hydroxylase (fatty acid hydroxylase superfamily)
MSPSGPTSIEAPIDCGDIAAPSAATIDGPADCTAVSRLVTFSLMVMVLALFVGFAAWMMFRLAGVASLDQFLRDIARPMYWIELSSVSFWWSPFVLVVAPLILVVTAVFPADRHQRVFSRGLVHDMVWSLTRTTLTVLLLTAYAAFLVEVFQRYFRWTIFEASDLPGFWRAAAVFIAADFLYWLRHVALHKVPIFWQFHAVHHSQRELNPFTIHRVHPVELMLSLSIWFIPMFAITTSLDAAVGYYLVRHGYDAFVHSNIRTNLGPLRFLLVTPQSHRVHHSSDARHYDTNFGAILSVWDLLFRTQYRDYNAYPKTGIPDPSFPNESKGSSPFITLARQLLHPFRALNPTRLRSAAQ